jgi:hypothetical protein
MESRKAAISGFFTFWIALTRQALMIPFSFINAFEKAFQATPPCV